VEMRERRRNNGSSVIQTELSSQIYATNADVTENYVLNITSVGQLQSVNRTGYDI
jgi:hypothetical protein